MQRVVIIGASGSGKSTLGRWLANELAFPFTDFDDLFWRPGWQESSVAEFRRDVDNVTALQSWVVAGNYQKVRDLVWPRADTLVWLDLPLLQVLWRTTVRASRQAWTGEPICNGNRQSLFALVRPPNSLLGYTLRTYYARRRDWPQALALPEHSHVMVIRLRSSVEVQRWQDEFRRGKRRSTDSDRRGRRQ